MPSSHQSIRKGSTALNIYKFGDIEKLYLKVIAWTSKLRIWFYFHNFDIAGTTDIWWNSTVYDNKIMIQSYCLFRAHRKREQDESLLWFWFATIKPWGETTQSGIHLCKNMHLAGANPSLTSFYRILFTEY